MATIEYAFYFNEQDKQPGKIKKHGNFYLVIGSFDGSVPAADLELAPSIGAVVSDSITILAQGRRSS